MAATSRIPDRFSDRVVLVTGAAGGLGTAIADRLHAEGARVALTDLVEIESGPEGERTVRLRLDATSEGDWTSTVEDVLERWGRLDGLVQCVGILGKQAPVTEVGFEEWERVVRINLHSAFLGLATCLPPMLEAGYGRVVTLSSIAAKEGNALQAAYSASKAGIVALTKSAAKEVATSGVTVNCLAPTMIRTSLVDGMEQSTIDELLAKIPMRRLGRPEEVAAIVTWLLSEEASYSTAQCFDLSGGRATY